MILKYTLSSDEYVAGRFVVRARMAKDRVLFRNLYGLAFVAALLALDSFLSGSRVLGIVLGTLAFAIFLERAILWRLREKAQYRRKIADHTVELRIEESNILRICPAGTGEIRWANIEACHEAGKLFVLRVGREDFLMIPRRAFAPGDLFRFKQLRERELIVRTTRTNPDATLLRFTVAWGIIAFAVIALFLGKIQDFFTQLPGARGNGASFSSTNRLAGKAKVASLGELRGRGTVYLVPIGTVKSISLPLLRQSLKSHYGVELHPLQAIPAPTWAWSAARKQWVAEDLVSAMKLAYPKLASDPQAILIGLSDDDMYIQRLHWAYAFSLRSDDRFAVISTARLSESDDDGKVPAPEAVQSRIFKVFARDIGILQYRLQLSSDSKSVLYRYVDEPSDLDDVGSDYLDSDTEVRAELHVEEGDPCLLIRFYTTPERNAPVSASFDGCSGYYKERNLEIVQIDLRHGLLLDQRTDFLSSDHFPLELTRVLRTQDPRPRAFGIGGNHNLNVFLVGDKWPFTWMDLILEHGGRSHFRRANWGFGYWDARFVNQDPVRNEFTGATVEWAWPGWKLKKGSVTYRFPPSSDASTPEQGGLIGMKRYDGAALDLNRNSAGELLLARSSSGGELDFTYDRAHRITQISEKNGGAYRYFYNSSGRLTRVIDADQRVTDYNYDSVGHVSRIVHDSKTLCTLAYDSADRVRAETLADGRTYQFNYVFRENELSGVDIYDSAGPFHRVEFFGGEYTLDVRGLNVR